ncbi:MAG: hypothetical protein LAT65_10035 [Saccharospirillum sp.]|nr:hypothetical protein [Saccharospirillum sp.]
MSTMARTIKKSFMVSIACLVGINVSQAADVSQTPLFVTNAVEPLVMLSMSNDHQLYFEAYPEYADLTGDGKANETYTHSFEYYGYFDSHKCYTYNTSNNRFEPVGITTDMYCDSVSGADWSGNFLNWVSMSRMDVVRKVLYGGYRSTDTSTQTILERSYLPMDAHSWARYYRGADIDKLTPFSYSDPVTTVSGSNVLVGTGDKTFATSDVNAFTTNQRLQRGDQIIIQPLTSTNTIIPDVMMLGYVNHTVNVSGEVTVNVSYAEGAGTSYSNWQLTNASRQGVSFCNITYANTGTSQNITAPPLIRAARGHYGLWNANERFQCNWHEEESADGRINFNDIGVTSLAANRRNPVRNQVGLGEHNYVARVEVCKSDLIGKENCKQYPDGNYKPVGLLQTYGDEGLIQFGLLSGSNRMNKSGGVLRKNIGSIDDEVRVDTDGTFIVPPASVGSIINTLDLQRMYGYAHGDGLYNTTDNCGFGLSSFNDGSCTGWGNPQSEIFLETLRYFANPGNTGPNTAIAPTNAYIFTGQDRIAGLNHVAWEAPLNDDNYCAPLSIINFNSSVASYDAEHFGTATDLPGIRSVTGGSTASPDTVHAWTNLIGEGEGIHGNDFFIGKIDDGVVSDTDGLCTSKTVGSLASAIGLCPEAPRLEGSYLVAGLAHYAYMTDIRPDLPSSSDNDKKIKTYAVALAPAVPQIDIPLPGGGSTVVRMLPACSARNNDNVYNSCALVDFKIIDQNVDEGTGSFLVNWENSEQGGDYDMDMIGILSYQITGTNITVTTRTTAETAPRQMGFGYVISGTTQDGIHLTSGVNGFNSAAVGLTGCVNCNLLDPAVSRTYPLSTSSSDSLARLLESPMYYAAKWSGFDRNLDFPTDQESWDSNGDGNPDNYYFAVNPRQLADDLDDVFRNIQEGAASAAAVVANSSRLGSDTAVFQATFNSERWSGDILAYKVDQTDGSVEPDATWSAADLLNNATPATRRIITNSPLSPSGGDGKLLSTNAYNFTWGSLDANQQAALRRNSLTEPGSLGDITYGQNRLAYLRGSRANERTEFNQTRPFRQRDSILGTIVGSDPQFYYRQNYGYDKLTFGPSYKAYRESAAYTNATARPPMIIAGSNNGMLHAFNAELEGTNAGQELFAYVPSSVIGNLYEYTLPGFNHRYYLDGVPRIADAIVDGQWKTVAVGTTGAGGSSVFALDITEPTLFGESHFLWEFSHPDMGMTIQQPSVVALPNNKFGVVVTSGYYDGTPLENGKVWIIDISNGDIMTTIELENSGELGSALVVDLTNNRIADRIYVGDTKGKLWRIDLDGSSPGDWGIDSALSEGPLFQAAANQPITGQLASAFNERGEHMVFFGTGSYFRVGDNQVVSPSLQAFYGIIDRENPIEFIDGVDDLVQQSIIAEVVEAGTRFRVVSDNEMEDDKLGWYMPLVLDDGSGTPVLTGERVVARPLIRGDRVIFPTLIPAEDMCAFGGDSWLMELNMFNGGRLNYPVFDIDGDGSFDDNDLVEVEIDGETVLVPPSGLGSEIGIISTPAVIEGVGPGEDEVKIISGSTGEMISVPEAGSMVRGRINWEQIR